MDRSAVTEERPALADSIAYWLIYPGIYILTGFLWYYAFKEKVFDDGAVAPAPIKKEFAGSFIASFPGTSLAWGILGSRGGPGSRRANRQPGPPRDPPPAGQALAAERLGFSMLIFACSRLAEHDLAIRKRRSALHLLRRDRGDHRLGLVDAALPPGALALGTGATLRCLRHK